MANSWAWGGCSWVAPDHFGELTVAQREGLAYVTWVTELSRRRIQEPVRILGDVAVVQRQRLTRHHQMGANQHREADGKYRQSPSRTPSVEPRADREARHSHHVTRSASTWAVQGATRPRDETLSPASQTPAAMSTGRALHP